MRGKILGADGKGGTISGADGKRYKFDFDDWKDERPPSPGGEVDFDIDGDGKAIEVFSLSAPKPTSGPAGQEGGRQGIVFGVISLVCGLLGFTPGFGLLFSIAAFFLGRTGRAKALAEGDSTGATLSNFGMILAVIAFVIMLVVLVGSLGFLGALLGFAGLSH